MWEQIKKTLTDTKEIKKTFVSEKKLLLQKLKAHEWQSPAEMQTILEEFSSQSNLLLEDVIWMALDIDPLRKFAVTLIPKINDPEKNTKIISFSKGKPPKAKELLLELLVQMNPTTLPRLVRLWANNKDEYFRTVALDMLPRTDPATAIPVASMLLSDTIPAVRLRALAYLSSTRQRNALWNCTALLEDPEEEIRYKAMLVLQNFTEPRLFSLLLELYQKEESKKIRDLAIQGLLHQIKASPERYEDEMLLFLKESDPVLRKIPGRMLTHADPKRILRKFILAFSDTFGWVRERALRSLKEEGEPFADGIIQLLDDPDSRVRSLAENIAVTIEHPKIVPTLIDMLQRDDWWLRYCAAECLARIGDSRAFQPLLEMLESDDDRLFAIQALGLMKDVRAIEHFANVLPYAGREEQLELLEALKNIAHPAGIPLLKVLYEKGADYVRVRAASVMNGISGANLNGRAKDADEKFEINEISSPGIGDFLRYAISIGASDLHLAVGAKPRVRVHRTLISLDFPELSQVDVQRLAVEGMSGNQLSTLASQRHVDYCFKHEQLGRFRTNIFLERNGMHATFRIIPRSVPSYESVGIPSSLKFLTYLHQGLVLVTGPSGCGKTTTLAGMVDHINENRSVHVITVEDPIEFVHTNKKSLISQRELGSHTGTFTAALRSALREDPDVVLVGEMRDLDTIRMAITAAETGHLVLSTLHTTSAANSIDRVISSFPPQEQTLIRTMLSESLKAVISQVLLPNPDKDGVVPAFEILLVTPAVAAMIRDGKTFQIPTVQQTRSDLGMCLMDQSLLKLLEQKKVDPTAAFARAINKDLLEPFLTI
ncbi:PilT/PilU family type 4a pilus ATPase [bacterium]|nr:PilT/PilU family type 4a pilus ATPase [bacterium]MCI0607176.1 PilT/PilU family type 4a pilus ATPase [bacterium]